MLTELLLVFFLLISLL